MTALIRLVTYSMPFVMRSGGCSALPAAGTIQDTWGSVPSVRSAKNCVVSGLCRAMYFVPLGQKSEEGSAGAGAIVIETTRPMNDMESIARRTLMEINPNLAVQRFETFDAQIADQFTEERMLARLTMLFGGLALLLATIGIYGVTAYTVVRRTSEIGIRMALGADRAGVIAMIMRGAVVQAGIGLMIGVPAALLGVRYVRAELYEVTRANPTVMILAMVTLAVATGIAGMIPARRAASTDPVQALRTE